MSFLKEVIIQTGVYLFVFIGSLLFFNFLTKGYLLAYIIVKAGRGKKVMVRIFAVTGRYYKPGIISETTLNFKDRSGTKKTPLSFALALASSPRSSKGNSALT